MVAFLVNADARPEPQWLERTWRAIVAHESLNGRKMYRRRENAAGWGHMRPVFVMDVNRILRSRGMSQRYTLADRFDERKAFEMFRLYVQHYQATTPERAARIYNGGPDAGPPARTLRYWRKIEAIMAEQKLCGRILDAPYWRIGDAYMDTVRAN